MLESRPHSPPCTGPEVSGVSSSVELPVFLAAVLPQLSSENQASSAGKVGWTEASLTGYTRDTLYHLGPTSMRTTRLTCSGKQHAARGAAHACSLQVRILDALLQVALFARPAQDPDAVLDIGHDDVVVGPGLRVRDVVGRQGLKQLHTLLVKPAQAQTSIGRCSVLLELMSFEQPSSLMAMAQALPGCLG